MDEENGEVYWKRRALESEKVADNLRTCAVTTSSGATTGSSSTPVIGKLALGHQQALRYHIRNCAWSAVKFIPNIHVFKINPEILERAKKGVGIKEDEVGDSLDASLMARYKYEINQKRSNVKTAVRKKYRGTSITKTKPGAECGD